MISFIGPGVILVIFEIIIIKKAHETPESTFTALYSLFDKRITLLFAQLEGIDEGRNDMLRRIRQSRSDFWAGAKKTDE